MPDMVNHLQRRCVVGNCVIIIDKPTLQLAVLRKEWLRGEYQVERQAASTLGERRIVLTNEHERLQTIHFKSAHSTKKGSIVLASPDDTTNLPESFATLYVLTNLTDGQRASFTAQLRRGGLIVKYTIAR